MNTIGRGFYVLTSQFSYLTDYIDRLDLLKLVDDDERKLI